MTDTTPGALSRAARARSGAKAYRNGVLAEDAVERDYARRGLPTVAQRWRGQAGEVDLICADGDGFVFVEVKRGDTHDAALGRVTARQIARIVAAAGEFLAARGLPLSTALRLDIGLVDRLGQVATIENVTLA